MANTIPEPRLSSGNGLPLDGRPPGPTECRVCGCVPAAEVSFRGHRGFMVFMQFLETSGPFCRDCGLAVFRDMTSSTLLQGWWGVISVFVNPVVIVINLTRRWKVARLAAPTQTPGVSGSLPRPMDPGRPLLLRAQALGGLSLVLVLTVGLGFAVVRGAQLSQVGGCVNGAEFVPCDRPHDGRILKIVSNPDKCPETATGFLRNRTLVYCLADE